MNNAAELIAEKDAAALARVSASTLARFAEAGYFQVETNGADRFYSRRALAAVFGVTLEETPSSVATRENVIPFPQQTVPRGAAEQQPVAVVADTIATPSEAEPLTSTPVEAPVDIVTPVAETPPQQVAPVSFPASVPESSSNLSQILQMHTDILSRQEREIQDLRSERDWLRRRIEKLEEKAERDQVLLLSEAQTVKQLIQLQAHKKSTIRQALEWFGLVEDQKLPAEPKPYQAIGSQSGSSTEQKEYASTDQNS